MTEQHLFAPPECSRVQAPVDPPPRPLLEQALELLQKPGTKQRDIVQGMHPYRYGHGNKTISATEGKQFDVDYQAPGSDVYVELNNHSLRVTTVQQGDVSESYEAPVKGAPLPWSVDDDAISKSIRDFVSNQRTSDFFGTSDEPAIKLTHPSEQYRVSTNWTELKSNGVLKIRALYGPNGSVAREEGDVEGKDGNRIGSFRYEFDQNGKATLCARSSNPNSSSADLVEYPTKID